MGGRGVYSMSAVNHGAIRSLADAKDFNQVRDYMDSSYGVTVDDSMNRLPLDSVKLAVGGIEDVAREFPQALHGCTVKYNPGLGATTYAQAWPSGGEFEGTIEVSDKFSDLDSLGSSYSRDVSSRWHPDGTAENTVTSHEAGHIVEAYLDKRNHSSYPDRVRAWNKHREATRIIGEAAKRAKKTPDGKGKKNAELVAEVSRYAEKNRSEAFAECVADYVANGENAKPLSREVYNILKSEI